MIDTSSKPDVLAARFELARLCRKICLSRELNPATTATIDDEMEAALATVRASFGPESVSSDDLLDLFQTETKRVADAAALAEIIIPRLQNALARAPISNPEVTTKTPRPRIEEKPKMPAGGLNIADMIDGMLDQERR